MKEDQAPVKEANGGFSDAEMKQGHRKVPKEGDSAEDGNKGEYMYRPGSTNDDSRTKGG